MTKSAMLFYFDLRRYGYIEKNKTNSEVFNILSEMHSIIEAGMDALSAEIYKVQTDTAVYILNNYAGTNIENIIRKIKIEVDSYMISNYLPSKLHICMIIGNYYSGYIKTGHLNQYNIFGDIMNKLEKYVYIIDKSDNKEINEGIVITKEAFYKLGIQSKRDSVNELDEELYIL